MRRSVAGVTEGGAAAGATPVSSAVPQSPQNFLPGGFEAPQEGQICSSAAPQSPQKRLSAGFSPPQFAQVITPED